MIIKREELLKALALLKPGIAKNDLIESSNQFCFMGNSIRSYNDEMQISIDFDTKINGALPVIELYKLLEKIPDEEIVINKEDNQVIIKGKKKKAKLVLSEISEVLESALIDKKKLKAWKNLPDDFVNGVKFCLFSISNDASEPILTCISIKDTNILSSDNNRVTKKSINGNISSELLIPGRIAKELIKYNPIKYCRTKSWIHFTNENNILFSCRAIDGTFPSTDRFFEVEGTKIRLPKNLKEIIDRSSIMTDEDEDLITLFFSNGKLICKGSGTNGSYEEESKIIYKGPDIKITVNPIFLSQILPLIKSVILGDNRLLFEGDGFSHVLAINE